MNAAYFSTATAIGSCSSYSRFTISGGLLMMDIGSPSSLLSVRPISTPAKHSWNRAFPCSLGWSDHHARSEVLPVSKIRRRAKRSRSVPHNFRSPRLSIHGRMSMTHDIGVEKHRALRSLLRKFQTQFPFANRSGNPLPVELFEEIATKAPPCFVKKFEVCSHRHDVVVPFPLPSNRKVAQEFAGQVGRKRLLDIQSETVLGTAKVRGSGRNVEQAKGLQVAEEFLVCSQMRVKTADTSIARIHKRKGDHRCGTGNGWREKEGKLVHEITDRGLASGTALINLCGKNVSGNRERVEQLDLVALAFEKIEFRVFKEKVSAFNSRSSRALWSFETSSPCAYRAKRARTFPARFRPR